VPVEEVDGLLVVPAHDGALIAPSGLPEVRRDVGRDAVLVLLGSEAIFSFDVLEVSRKALVEPGVGPVAARDVVPEPVVRELVRHEVVARDVEGGPFVEEHCSYIVVAVVFSMPPNTKSLTTTCE